MGKIIQWGGAAGIALILAGCDLSGIGGPAKTPATGPRIIISQAAAPSALLAVLPGPASGPALAALVGATARPREDLAVLAAASTVLSSAAPSPATVVVAGRPAAPGSGETSYQQAQYTSRLTRWQDEVSSGRRAEATQTRDAVSAWVRGLALQVKSARLTDPAGRAAGLAAECADAASALAGLAQADGNVFGTRRVIVLYSDDLMARPPAGSLTGDRVIVITQFTPTGAQASAAQADLLAAGAAQAAVAGPEVTSGQIAALVSAGLSQGAADDSVSAPVLFSNDSAALSGHAVSALTALLARLRESGAAALINGFASSTGGAAANYRLSYQRAAAVAAFFESRDVPASSLIIVGHGASDLVAPGASGDNRRVIVVLQAP